MWQNMCPAQVYEVPEEELEAALAERQRQARRQARGRSAHHAVELRAVRGDHRQGRAPDAARGRRRPELPGDLTSAELIRLPLHRPSGLGRSEEYVAEAAASGSPPAAAASARCVPSG